MLSGSRGWKRQALLHCIGLSVGRAAMQMCLTVRYETPFCRAGITHNVSICVRAGLPKPRGVPDTERTKDTKTLDYASTPLDANTLLAAVSLLTVLYIQRLPMTVERLEFISEITINVRNKKPVQKLVPGLFPFIVLILYPFC